MAYTLLDATFTAILANAPLMAVKAMNASDVQLQIPTAMTSVGMFASVFTGAAMAARRKIPFVLAPGIAGAICTLGMAWTGSAAWFLAMAGVITLFDFAKRPAVPSIMRMIYPHHCQSHVSGVMRQYAAIVSMAAALLSSYLLAASGTHVGTMIHVQIATAGLASLGALLCFSRLPSHGDGSAIEATPENDVDEDVRWPSLTPFKDRRFRRYLAIFFLFAFANLFHASIVPAFMARDMGLGYVKATLLLFIIPNVTGFLAGGRLTAWFDRTTIWRSYSLVTLMWGLDPVLLATLSSVWPAVIAARMLRGPALVGSYVISFFTGVQAFARPGRETSRYMAAMFPVTGFAQLLAPSAAAFALSYLSRRGILLSGGVGVLVASALFLWSDWVDSKRQG